MVSILKIFPDDGSPGFLCRELRSSAGNTLNLEILKESEIVRTSHFRIHGGGGKLRPKESFEGREKAVCLLKMNRSHPREILKP